jgi:hypothetical protein
MEFFVDIEPGPEDFDELFEHDASTGIMKELGKHNIA